MAERPSPQPGEEPGNELVAGTRTPVVINYLAEFDFASQGIATTGPADHAYTEDFTEAVNTAHEGAGAFYARAGIEIPELGDMAASGLDAHRLQRIFSLMSRYGMKPEVVMSHEGLDLQTWRNCFARLSQAIHEPVMVSGDIGPGSSPGVEANWDNLGLSSTPAWTVSVISGSARTPYNFSHDLRQLTDRLYGNTIKSLRDGYPTLAEYLTLQALRYQGEREPIDLAGHTWLRGTVDGGKKAPLGSALPALETAAVTCAPTETQFPEIYIRTSAREIATPA